MRPQDPEVAKLRCPLCGRFLADVKGYGKAVCRDCGSELTYRSKEERNRQAAELRVLTAS